MRGKIVATGVEENGNARGDHRGSNIGAVAAVGCGDVLEAVLVEVTGDERGDTHTGGSKGARRAGGERAVSAIEKDTHHVAAGLSGDQVGMAVIIEIGLKNVIGDIRAAVGGRRE